MNFIHASRIFSLIALSLSLGHEVRAAGAPWRSFGQKSDDWYNSAEGQRTVANILSWQAPNGAWPKNLDTTKEPFTGDRSTIQGTFDNGATTGELRFLARAIRVARNAGSVEAFQKGLDHILRAQYANGGWPQFYPPGSNYHRHITFNDDAMVRLLQFLRDVAGSPEYEFVDGPRRASAKESFDRGIQCILKCQIVIEGQPTVWCAQHDEVDFKPRPARTFELASLSGAESAAILRLLMSLDRPSAETIRAIDAGAAWFESVKLTGIRQTVVNRDKKIINDAAAPPLWARFYEIGTNRPIFAGRDAVKKYDIAEIEPERRNGYAWYGNWGAAVASEYAQWKPKWKSQR